MAKNNNTENKHNIDFYQSAEIAFGKQPNTNQQELMKSNDSINSPLAFHFNQNQTSSMVLFILYFIFRFFFSC